MFDIGLEAMQAQVQSKLGAALDKLWQKVIDYRDRDLFDVKDFKARYKMVSNFFMKNCAVEFMDLVWKYVGLWYTSVETTEIWEGGMATTSYFGGDPKKPYGSVQISDMLTGEYYTRVFGSFMIPKVLTPEELVKIAESFDSKIGGIRNTVRNDIRKLVKAKLYFDVRTAFLLEDWLPSNSGVTNFTAQEITAILLHEIGHSLTLVEHAADQYAHAATFNYLTRAFAIKADSDPGQAITLVEKAADLVETKKGNKQMATALRNFAAKAKVEFMRAGCSADASTAKKFFGGLIDGAICIFCDVFLVPLHILFGCNTVKLSAADRKKKFGDLPVNTRLMTWEERKADEYAQANGYGAPLVVALDKLDKLYARIGKTEEECAQITSAEQMHKKLGLFTVLGIVLDAPCSVCDFSSSLYPAGSKRFKEVLGNTIQQLKANGADPAYIRKYMEDIEIILDRIDHADRYSEVQANIFKGYELVMSYLSLPSIFNILVNGRIDRELDRLIDDVQTLSTNMIYYYGLKLQILAKKG